MAGIYKVNIVESVDELKQLLCAQKGASDKERIHLLYLLKSEQASTVEAASVLLGRHRVTVQKWLRLYRNGGLAGLLSHKPRLGRSPSIPQWAQEALNKRLHQGDGFNSYGEICQWLKTELGIESPYKTVHQLVRYRLKASAKVARPVSTEQSEQQVEMYKKNLSENVAMLAWFAVSVLGLSGQVRFFCEDETRIGLKTISGRKITARGVKPKGKVQWQFRATYLYGVVEPATGEHFFYEFTHLNTDCFPDGVTSVLKPLRQNHLKTYTLQKISVVQMLGLTKEWYFQAVLIENRLNNSWFSSKSFWTSMAIAFT